MVNASYSDSLSCLTLAIYSSTLLRAAFGDKKFDAKKDISSAGLNSRSRIFAANSTASEPAASWTS